MTIICPNCKAPTNCPTCGDEFCVSCGTDLTDEEMIPFTAATGETIERDAADNSNREEVS